MLKIKYIAEVDVATGVIDSVATVGGGLPPAEGTIPNTDAQKHRWWLLSDDWADKDPYTIQTEYFRKDSAWVHRGPPPSQSHIWNTTSEAWEFNTNEFMSKIRFERNRRLNLCDWTQVPDVPLTDTELAQWRSYRAILRDLPESINTNEIQAMEAVPWPSPPNGETIEMWIL